MSGNVIKVMLMVLLVVSIQGNIWHSLIEQPLRISIEVSKIFRLKIFFKEIIFPNPVAVTPFQILIELSLKLFY